MDDHDVHHDASLEDKAYLADKVWNRKLEPEVIIPCNYNEKMQRDRVQEQGSILEKMQRAFDMQVNLNRKY
jgi:hypothetical protein